MTVRRAIEIFNNFIMQAKNETVLDKENIRSEKKKKQEANFDQKKIERIEKLQKEIQALEQEKKNSKLDKEIKILDKEITAIKNTIEKITEEEYKEQTYIDEATGNEEKSRAKLAEEKIAARGQTKKETAEEKSNEKQQQARKGEWETTKKVERGASIKKNESRTALKKAKQKGKAAVKAAAKEELFNRDNAKEESKTDMLISKEESAKDKKQKSKEAPF